MAPHRSKNGMRVMKTVHRHFFFKSSYFNCGLTKAAVLRTTNAHHVLVNTNTVVCCCHVYV